MNNGQFITIFYGIIMTLAFIVVLIMASLGIARSPTAENIISPIIGFISILVSSTFIYYMLQKYRVANLKRLNRREVYSAFAASVAFLNLIESILAIVGAFTPKEEVNIVFYVSLALDVSIILVIIASFFTIFKIENQTKKDDILLANMIKEKNK